MTRPTHQPRQHRRERMDQENVRDVIEERHASKREPTVRTLECRKQQEAGAQRHRQIEQRRRILFAIVRAGGDRYHLWRIGGKR
jgi:hypothetical protein